MAVSSVSRVGMTGHDWAQPVCALLAGWAQPGISGSCPGYMISLTIKGIIFGIFFSLGILTGKWL